jgi:hypothetical protein
MLMFSYRTFLFALGLLPAMLLAFPSTAEEREKKSVFFSGESVDAWVVERGSVTPDKEQFLSMGASIRFDESGVYYLKGPVPDCDAFSCSLRPGGKGTVKVVGHLRDRTDAHYILETRYLPARAQWQTVEFRLDSAKLAPWSIDLNHHLDFPLNSVGLMVTLEDGDRLNLDQVSLHQPVGTSPAERALRRSVRDWTRELQKTPPGAFRDITPSPERIVFEENRDAWVVTSTYYRAVLDPASGTLRRLRFGPSGAPPVEIHPPAAWTAVTWEGHEIPAGIVTDHRWDPKRKSLALEFEPSGRVEGELVYTFGGDSIEMQLRLHNRGDRVIRWVRFPAEVEVPRDTLSGVFWPRLGGVELLPSFFGQGRFSRAAYPADGFSDWMAFDLGGRVLSFGTIQSNAIFQPAEPVVRGDTERNSVLYYHDVSVFIPPGSSWTLCPVVARVAPTALDCLRGYRDDNGWDEAPSLRDKLGAPLFERMSRTPLLKWDFDLLSREKRSGRNTFDRAVDWAAELPGLFLIHPVSYWNPSGRGPEPDKIFDRNHPNFIPAADRMGGDAAFQLFLRRTRKLGHPVAPYINPTAWGEHALGFEDYGEDIAVLDEKGNPHRGWGMLSADPFHPVVRNKSDELVDAFAGSHRVDLLFEDQVGARPNYLNLRFRGPHPTAYTEGWIRHAKQVSERIPLMTERGFDALIPFESAFCGVELGLACTTYMKGHDWNARYGEGNWRVFPVDSFLCHDKCALYHHDLGQFILSDSDLAWTLVRGYNLQMHYPGPDRWIRVCEAFQEAVGPALFGEPMESFEYLTDYVVKSRFPRLEVVANFHPEVNWTVVGNHSIPPDGVIAVADGGRIVAGVVDQFNAVSFEHHRYLVKVQTGGRILFRDLFPSGETYRLLKPRDWPDERGVDGEVVTARGRFALEVREGRTFFEVTYPETFAGEPVEHMEFRPGRRR